MVDRQQKVFPFDPSGPSDREGAGTANMSGAVTLIPFAQFCPGEIRITGAPRPLVSKGRAKELQGRAAAT